MRCRTISLLVVLAYSLPLPAVVPEDEPAPQRPVSSPLRSARVAALLKDYAWVAYAPSEADPSRQPPVIASESSLRKDLSLLAPHFDGIVLYNTDEHTELLLRLCRHFKMKAICALWYVNGKRGSEERDHLVRLCQQFGDVVLGVCAGNETQLFRRATLDELEDTLKFLREALPDLPITTSEPISTYGLTRFRRLDVDFLAPLIHPWFAGDEVAGDPDAAVAFVRSQVIGLRKITHGRIGILVKESGLPYKNHPLASESKQSSYWRKLPAALQDLDNVNYAVFEAFALDFKARSGPGIENAWGVFRSARNGRKPLPAVRLFHRRAQ